MSSGITARKIRGQLIATLLRVRAVVYLVAGIPLLAMPEVALTARIFGVLVIAHASIYPYIVGRFNKSTAVRTAAASDLFVAFGMWLLAPALGGLALMLAMWAVAYAVLLGPAKVGRSIASIATTLELSKLVVLWLGAELFPALPVVAAGNASTLLIVGGGVAIGGAYYSFRQIDRYFVAVNDAAETGGERYRKLIDTAPMAFIVVVEDRIAYANNAGTHLLELTGGSLIGRNFFDFIEKDSINGFKKVRARVLNLLETVEGEQTRLVASDGSAVWVDLSANAVDYGHDLAIQLMLIDRSGQLLAEEELQRTKIDYQTFFERIPVAMYRSRPDGTIAHVNQAMVDLVGVEDKSEIVGKNARTFYVDETERDRLTEMLEEEGIVAGYEWRLKTSDGMIRWVRDTARLIDTRSGSFYEGAVVDVTARRNVEEELWARAVQQEAVASIGQLALQTEDVTLLCESLADIVSEVLGIGGVAVMCRDSKGLFQIIGSNPGLTVEATVLSGIADRTHMSAAPVVLRSVAEVKFAAPGLLEHGNQSCIALMVTSNEINFGTLVVVAREERGFSSDDLNFLYSVSSVLAAAVDRAGANNRLEALLASKDAFVASVSHELRTPLTVVSGLAYELRQRWMTLSDEEMAEFTMMLVGQSEEMAGLIEDLLVAAQANIGNVLIRIVPVGVSGEVDSVIVGFKSQTDRTISADVPDVTIDADPIRLRQILRNLVSNAIRYGGEAIEVTGFVASGLFVIEVKDNGPPIAEEDRARIFQPYERAHETAGRPGSVGLGLSVSRTLAELMRGSLTYRHDGLSTFRLELPASISTLDGTPAAGVRVDDPLSAFRAVGAGRIGVDVDAIK